MVGSVGVKGLSKKEKRMHGHGQQCGDYGGYKGTKWEWKKIQLKKIK